MATHKYQCCFQLTWTTKICPLNHLGSSSLPLSLLSSRLDLYVESIGVYWSLAWSHLYCHLGAHIPPGKYTCRTPVCQTSMSPVVFHHIVISFWFKAFPGMWYEWGQGSFPPLSSMPWFLPLFLGPEAEGHTASVLLLGCIYNALVHKWIWNALALFAKLASSQKVEISWYFILNSKMSLKFHLKMNK